LLEEQFVQPHTVVLEGKPPVVSVCGERRAALGRLLEQLVEVVYITFVQSQMQV
jgi:hypothetical protein